MVSLLFRGEDSAAALPRCQVGGTTPTASGDSRHLVAVVGHAAGEREKCPLSFGIGTLAGGAEIGISPPVLRSMRGRRRLFSWARGGRVRLWRPPLSGLDRAPSWPTVSRCCRR